MMVDLKLLGCAFLSRDGVAITGRSSQKRHLALLAMLSASPGGSASRDKLIGYLWPESDAARARHRLSVALHVIRQELGRESLITSGDSVTLSPEHVWTDVGAFVDQIEQGRLNEAVELYRGMFLDGFFLNEDSEFEGWVEGQRTHLSGLYRAALERLVAEAEATPDPQSRVLWSKRLAEHDPFSTPAALAVLRALADVGDLAGAVRHARAYATLMEGQLGLPPDPEVMDLADELAARAARMRESRRADATAGPRASSAASTPDRPAPPMGEDRAARGASPGTLLPRRARVFVGGAALSAILGLWFVADAGEPPPSSPTASLRSIAVLDFVRAGFDDGLGRDLAEGVRDFLREVPGLEVASPLSSAPGTEESGSGAHAEAVLTGSLRTEPEHVALDVEVRDRRTGALVWTRRYSSPQGPAPELAEDLSLAIAHDVRVDLVPYVPKEYTRSRRAYQRFLLGVYAMRRTTSEDLWQALQFHREAYEEDPQFALAHAIAGTAYIHLVGRGVSPEMGYELAREHVMEALALDDGLAEGHAALGQLQVVWDRDFDAGARSLRRAMMLYPTLPQAHAWYGYYLLYVRNRPEAAVAHVRRSLEVDPLNTARSQDVEWALYRARRYEEVERQNEVTRSLDPEIEALLGGSPLGHAYRELGRYEESIAEFRSLDQRVGGVLIAGAAMAYGRIGRVSEALAIARELEDRAGGGPPLPLARIYANLGQTDRALAWLRVAEERRPDAMLQISVDPALDPIRADPRFVAIVERTRQPRSTSIARLD